MTDSGEEDEMFRKILVGLDGSEAARHALASACRLAKLAGATVHALSVEEHLPAYAATVGEVQDAQRFENQYFHEIHVAASSLAAQHEVPLTHEIVPGHAAQVLIRTAREGGFDLIVLGHTGHSRLHNLFLGSTADRVVEHAACTVLVVR
jgi:nucleotide-binding universal stress UspA family protein